MKQYLLAGALALSTLTGCVSTGSETLKSLDEMNELEFSRVTTYISLGTRVGASRLLESGEVTAATLEAVADAIEGLVGQPLLELSGGWITDAVASSVTLTSDELLLVLIIVEQEVLARGGGTYIDDLTGGLHLTERTETLLLIVASALRSAATTAENDQVTVTADGINVLSK